MATVGVVGVGLLGSAIASRLLAAGHQVVGYDVVSERLDALKKVGGRVGDSVAAVASEAEAVCFVLPSLASVEQAILSLPPAGSRGGPAVIQMSTISPTLTARLAREMAARELTFLDCPVSGTSTMVARGDGIFFVGSDRGAFDRWQPMLESILPRVIHVGAPGQAMVVKLIANLLVGLNTAAAAEALLMARRAGLDPGMVVNALAGGAATSRMLELRGPMMARGEFPAQMKLDLFMKDLHLILEAGRNVGAPLPLTTVAEREFAAALAAGHAPEDLAVVFRALEAMPAE